MSDARDEIERLLNQGPTSTFRTRSGCPEKNIRKKHPEKSLSDSVALRNEGALITQVITETKPYKSAIVERNFGTSVDISQHRFARLI